MQVSAVVAQRIARLVSTQKVVGSNPIRGTQNFYQAH